MGSTATVLGGMSCGIVDHFISMIGEHILKFDFMFNQCLKTTIKRIWKLLQQKVD